MVSDFLVLVCVGVRKRDQEFAPGEGVEVLACVSFNPSLIPDGGLLALSVYLCNDLVEIAAGVHTLPHRFTVGWIITTRVVLLSSVVNEGDAASGEGEDGSGFELVVFATVVVEKTRVVVVVNEQTKGVQIFEITCFSIVAGLDATHICT